jgi:hypothetical protein
MAVREQSWWIAGVVVGEIIKTFDLCLLDLELDVITIEFDCRGHLRMGDMKYNVD